MELKEKILLYIGLTIVAITILMEMYVKYSVMFKVFEVLGGM